MNAEKWHHSEIPIAINDESQGSIAKNLRYDETDRLTPSVTDRLLTMYGILPRQLFFVAAVVHSG